MSAFRYIGIPKRFLALIIDGLVCSVAYFILGVGLTLTEGSAKWFIYSLLTIVIQGAYFIFMESSPTRATLGKMALEMAVIGENGRGISLGQAFLRYLGKLLWFGILMVAIGIAFRAQETGGDESPYWLLVGLLMIVSFLLLIVGYLMAGFTPEKQALHDRIARTYVIDAEGQSRSFSQKTLLQLGAILLIARFLLQIVPTTPLIPLADNTLPIDTPVSEEPSSPTANSPTSRTLTLCGVTEQVFRPTPSSYIDGVWRIEFSPSGILHQSILQMQGEIGKMRTEYFDSQSQDTKAVLQDIQLVASARGLWLLGSNPVDENNQTVTTYSPDNIFFQQTPDGSLQVSNCDAQGIYVPASLEYLGENP